jgi:hypothetical protein
MIEGIKCPECGSNYIWFKLLCTSETTLEYFDYSTYQCANCKNVFPVEKKENSISKLENLLIFNKSLIMLEDLDPLAFKKFIEAEKKSFASLKSEDECASINNKTKTKRYFVSFSYNDEKGFGFGSIITECDSLDIKEIEKYIRTEYNFSSVVVLYYKEMKENEK